ncbi:MAG: bacteriohemerythrin [Rhodospirillaceae bacterium]
MLIKWDETLSIGDDLIDRDHIAIVGIINRLDDAVEHQKENEAIADILSDLSDYISYHFDHEEQIMRRHKYDETSAHIDEHATLIKGLDSLVYKFETDPGIVGNDTLNFLKHWLVDHIMSTDRKLGLFLRQNTNRR